MSHFIFAQALDLIMAHQPANAVELKRVMTAIRGGREPTTATLDAAPIVLDFELVFCDGYAFLSGTVLGHPTIADGPILTSVVCAIDIQQLSWARTKNRFYRLPGRSGSKSVTGFAPAETTRPADE